jgi:hypothetical protein
MENAFEFAVSGQFLYTCMLDAIKKSGSDRGGFKYTKWRLIFSIYFFNYS